ncbi:PIN domain-containing protein [Candidatus Uhrbacteria bacterium]|nr:PIN domain-containing protein [Candidatus Uhrbacteria bacterium]
MALVLLDTNVLILHIGGFEKIVLPPLAAAVSTITVFELIRYPGLSSQEVSAIQSILDECIHISVGTAIAQRAASLSKTRPKMKSLDLFIAATALELSCPLITHNVKDFKGIKNLVIRSKI